MKKLVLGLSLVTALWANSQTVVQYDYMETWSTGYATSGWWIPATTATWATNIAVSGTNSAVIYGVGNGSSGTESDWYSLPNITGLNTSHPYQLKFKLASQTFTSTSAATRGLDAADLLEVQVSTNGGVSYVSELRITGNSNAIWPYTATGAITHTANGSFTNSAAPTGDVYQSPAGATTTGYSTVTLNLPAGISQVAIDIFCRVNSAGEEWWLDNIQLIEIFPLPVEMVTFEGVATKMGNVITWQTASENNSDYYLLERSVTGEFSENDVVNITPAAGMSTQLLNYAYVDVTAPNAINYYQLTQMDRDGNFKVYGPIAIDNTAITKTIVKRINMMGQEILDSDTTPGMYFEIYEDGTSKKVYK